MPGEKGKTDFRANGWALAPFLVFVAFYLGLSLYVGDFYRVSMPVAFVVASATAMVFRPRLPLTEKIDAFAYGMGETNIMMMCLVFILSGAFAAVAKGAGAVDAAVLLAQTVIPARMMVAGVFVISALISLSIGTSCGTIAAVTPIALGFAGPLGLDPALLLGATVGGSMFGDNLSMISDTTIAATRTQEVAMRDKFVVNVRIAVPAALAAVACYAVAGSSAGCSLDAPAVTWRSLALVAPYALVFVLALAGFNVMALLFTGTVLVTAIGLALGSFGLFGPEEAPGALDLAGKGMLDMSDTLIVAILAGGLFRAVQRNGGILWLTERIARLVRGPRSCELGVGLLVAAVNLFTANNTVAIVIVGPIAKTSSESFRVRPERIASVLDTVSCIVQGVIPYGAQILIALGVARGAGVSVGAFDLIAAFYYQPLLAIAVLASMALNRK